MCLRRKSIISKKVRHSVTLLVNNHQSKNKYDKNYSCIIKLYFPDSDGNFAYDNPCWNDDREHELIAIGYKTIEEWNSVGKVVKKGEKGSYLPCAKKRVFSESQTTISNYTSVDTGVKKHFDTFELAMIWAKENIRKAIMISPDGNGYITKNEN